MYKDISNTRYVVKAIDRQGRTIFKEERGNSFTCCLSLAKKYTNIKFAQNWIKNYDYWFKNGASSWLVPESVMVVTEEEAINSEDKIFNAIVCSEGKVYFKGKEVNDSNLIMLLKEVANFC